MIPGLVQRWKAAIAARNIYEPSQIQELYEIAVSLGLAADDPKGRLNIFATACMDARRGQIPGMLLRENVIVQAWRFNADDVTVARRVMAKLDRQTQPVA